MPTSSRKIGYVLGAGFSFGSLHYAKRGQVKLHMPLQNTLFEEICRFHYKKIRELDLLAKVIRRYFSPNTSRTTRGKGASRHRDLFGISIEDVLTFFDEIATARSGDVDEVSKAAERLQILTAEYIGYLSTNGRPGQNRWLRAFVDRLAETDVVVSFNWDTCLDQVLFNRKGKKWNPAWGYGRTIRNGLKYGSHSRHETVPRRYVRLLKLHGSVNWVAGGQSRAIEKRWFFDSSPAGDVVMIPPKMIKPEINGRFESTSPASDNASEKHGNRALPQGFYRDLWHEAEEQLGNCRRLVFIGYSFPAADFAVSNLLR